jgi:hypothetical protein
MGVEFFAALGCPEARAKNVRAFALETISSPGIEIDGCSNIHSELFPEVFLPEQALPCKGFAGGHVAIGLNIPSPHDVPLLLFDKFLDSFKEGGIVFLHPLIKDRLIMIKDEAVELPAKIRCGAKGGDSLSRAFLPFPEPGGVDMGVAHEKNLFTIHEYLYPFLIIIRGFF